MNDVIYRQDAADFLCDWCGICPKEKRNIMECDDIAPNFANIPSVDAVEVVRCKNCKHRFNGEHHDNCCDVLMEKVKWTFEVTVEPDWFCADGERKTDETD